MLMKYHLHHLQSKFQIIVIITIFEKQNSNISRFVSDFEQTNRRFIIFILNLFSLKCFHSKFFSSAGINDLFRYN
jgi:hypothetical protein